MIMNDETGELHPIGGFSGLEDKWYKVQFHVKLKENSLKLSQIGAYDETHNCSKQTKKSKKST